MSQIQFKRIELDKIAFIPVESSNIHSIGYDEETTSLYVKFLNNGIYRYLDVPSQEFSAIIAAESCGKYLNGSIKTKYKYEKVV